MFAFAVRSVLWPLVALLRLALLPVAFVLVAAAFGAYLSDDVLGCVVCGVLSGVCVEARKALYCVI